MYLTCSVQFWDENRESLVHFLAKSHCGLKGLVTDSVTGAAVAGARVRLGGRGTVTTTSRGEYWKLVTAGTYTVVGTTHTLASSVCYLGLPGGPLPLLGGHREQ